MSTRLELTGRQFSRLLVITATANNRRGESMWLCRCKCGVETVVRGKDLIRTDARRTRSCSCLRAEASLHTITRVNLSRTQQTIGAFA